jgi:beta-ribofuranosylaminobenzene 5'-phosphate synthase
MRTVVEAGARIHLGFLDLGGGCGRRFGSIGVSLERPRCIVEAMAGSPRATETTEPVRAIVERLGPDLGDVAVSVRLAEAIPSHAGFGSGTQHALAVALAATRAAGRPAPIRDLARRLRRGQRSGIGVAAFEHGGLVIDAGHRVESDGDTATPEIDGSELPPVVFQHPLPDDWHFVLATPRAEPGLSGTTELRAFQELPPMDDGRVGRICRLTLMQVAPAALTGDIRAFGRAISEIQQLVGEYFAPCQGGRFASATGCQVTELALARGAHGVGQSSWGPTVFALVESESRARALGDEIRTAFGGRLTAVDVSRARNRGASCREVP